MTLDNLISSFVELLDTTNPESITADTYFQELDEWCSLLNMGLVAMIESEYGKSLTLKEIRSCDTIRDLFNLIQEK